MFATSVSSSFSGVNVGPNCVVRKAFDICAYFPDIYDYIADSSDSSFIKFLFDILSEAEPASQKVSRSVQLLPSRYYFQCMNIVCQKCAMTVPKINMV